MLTRYLRDEPSFDASEAITRRHCFADALLLRYMRPLRLRCYDAVTCCQRCFTASRLRAATPVRYAVVMVWRYTAQRAIPAPCHTLLLSIISRRHADAAAMMRYAMLYTPAMMLPRCCHADALQRRAAMLFAAAAALLLVEISATSRSADACYACNTRHAPVLLAACLIFEIFTAAARRLLLMPPWRYAVFRLYVDAYVSRLRNAARRSEARAGA